MIGIQLVTHGKLGHGLSDALQMIVGDVPQFAYCQLKSEQSIADYRQAVLIQTQSLEEGQGVLVFADLLGGTPYNTACFNSRHFSTTKYQIITGVNLSLLISAVLKREEATLTELVQELMQPTEWGIELSPFGQLTTP